MTFICLCMFACKAHSQKTSGADCLVAQPVSDRTIIYSVSDAGVSKPVAFGLDLAWLSEGNIRRGISFMGRPQVKMIRSSFTPTDSLVNGDLKPKEMGILRQRLNIIKKWMGPASIVLNDDHPSVSRWFKNPDGTGNVARWSQLIDITAKHHQEQGDTIITVEPFNEPDYSATGQGTIVDFYNIARELKNNPRFRRTRISGGNTLSPDSALAWYNYLKTWLDEGNTHQLAGSFDNYVNFFRQLRSEGKYATSDELHNVMEAMVGAEYGMQTAIWWGSAELARGEFCKASDGVRLGYSEHRLNWTAASVYRSPAGKVQAFGGTSERQAVSTSYRFVSRDRDVYYDGYGPQREYTMVLPGGHGYQKGQTNAERVVNITWGEDIQPAIKGRYILVNRSNGKIVEVAGGSAKAGANLQAGTYTGATYQQWNVLPVPSTIGGDFSYFTLTAAHSGKAADVYKYSLENGEIVDAWDSTASSNQQWFFDYSGNGWFYIRSRESAKCLEISSGGTRIDQWDVTGTLNQQWRLLPVDAAIEFVAPGSPTGLKASANTESVTLTWRAGREPDIAGYTIFRAGSPVGPYNTIARNVTTTAFVDNTATSGQRYYYKIKAIDRSLNNSSYTNIVSASPTGIKSLVSHWPFNGNTNDTSVNRNHCATYGAVSYIPGKIESAAIQLDGQRSFVQLPATVANHTAITIAAWIYWNGGGAWQRIFDFGNDSSQYLFLTPNSGSGTLRFGIKNGGSEQQLNATSLARGAWTHIAVTVGAGGARMYVNGALVAQSGSITIRPTDFRPVLNYVGRSQYPDPLFNGSIDDFRIYNYALSPAEIAGLNRFR